MTILAVGAHPDDIEFGCGGVLMKERLGGSSVDLLLCSWGEAGSNGTAEERRAESEQAASLLGANIHFVDCGGDGLMEREKAFAIEIAKVIRKTKPLVVLAPSLEDNQHPDHAVVGHLVREACRLARYAGLAPLGDWDAHSIQSLMFYAITPDAEPTQGNPLLMDIGMVYNDWVRLMECHQSQMKTRNYVELQTARARLEGSRIGRKYAQALFPNDALLIEDLKTAPVGVRVY